jgi:hypothetical protein
MKCNFGDVSPGKKVQSPKDGGGLCVPHEETEQWHILIKMKEAEVAKDNNG